MVQLVPAAAQPARAARARARHGRACCAIIVAVAGVLAFGRGCAYVGQGLRIRGGLAEGEREVAKAGADDAQPAGAMRRGGARAHLHGRCTRRAGDTHAPAAPPGSRRWVRQRVRVVLLHGRRRVALASRHGFGPEGSRSAPSRARGHCALARHPRQLEVLVRRPGRSPCSMNECGA
ncbi:hypothetical protein T492DRAFT_978486 [Pavlovales sp. CCMP2436]|nr:hypothetical protein T492DRAFT_978486 [Pavlovales sp. CCMP2436]